MVGGLPITNRPYLFRGEMGGRLCAGDVEPRINAQSASASLVYKPDTCNLVNLYYQGRWGQFPFSTVSLDISTLSNATAYDAYLFWNPANNNVTLEASSAWTNVTTRGFSFDSQDGIPVKASDPTRRWVGSFYVLSGTTQLTKQFQHVWNKYNPCTFTFEQYDTEPSWSSLTNGTWRPFRGQATNRIEVFSGENLTSCIQANVSLGISIGGTGQSGNVGVGRNSTSAAPVGLYSRMIGLAAGNMIGTGMVNEPCPLGLTLYYAMEEASSGSAITYLCVSSGVRRSGILAHFTEGG
jgi:hypothetical protein